LSTIFPETGLEAHYRNFLILVTTQIATYILLFRVLVNIISVTTAQHL
jgi:hypothetical protein